MTYLLYHDKDRDVIQIKNGGKVFKDLPYTEEVQRHNGNYYFSNNRKALAEKGHEIKEAWKQELLDKLKAIECIKI